MKLTAFDKFTLRFAPRWTANRIQARAALGVTLRHYDAASPGRRTSGWARSAGDVNVTAQGALLELRMHARDLIRNNAWARRAQRVIANNTAGILPKARGPSAAASAKATELWNRWAGSTECESEGRHTFYGIQKLAMQTIVESGEVLIRRRARRPEDGLTIPLQLQVLEPDFIDSSKNTSVGPAGGPIIQGVEFDKLGKRAAYWLYAKHPGSGLNVEASRRVDAADVAHIFFSERPGQVRGVSWFAPAILNLKDFDEYEDATIMRQKVAALFAGVVVDPDGTSAVAGVGEPSAVNPLVETLEPGTMSYLPPGKDIRFANPPTVTEDAFTTRTLRRVAAALGVTYEDMTGDYSQVNFSSGRMGRLAHWANVRDWQENMLIPLLCDVVWGWAMQAAILAEELPAGPAPLATWTPPPMPMLEPDKEGLAIQRLIRTGVKTLSEAIREQGLDPDTHLAEYAADLAKLDALGIILDSDARKTTAAGQEQSGPASAAENASADPKEEDPPADEPKKPASDSKN